MWLGLVEFVKLYRVAFFTGVFGSGKTLGAVSLAVQLLSENRKLKFLSNLPISSLDLLSLDSLCSSVILLDEGRRYLDSRRWSSRDFNIDYLRHIDCYLLIAAAFDVDTRLRRLTVERIFHFLKIPIWFYRVRVYDQTGGRLAVLLLPQAFWGLYPQRYILSSSEDYFYTLLDEFFSGLSYVHSQVSDLDKERIRSVVQATVSSIRGSS